MDRTPRRTVRGGATSAPQTPHGGLQSYMLPPGSPWAGGSSGSARGTPLRQAGGGGPGTASPEPVDSPRQAKRGDATPRAADYQHVLREIDDIKRRLDAFMDLQVGGGGSDGGLAPPSNAPLPTTPEHRHGGVEASPSPRVPDLGAAVAAEGGGAMADTCCEPTPASPPGRSPASEERSRAQILGTELAGVEEQADPEDGPGALSGSLEGAHPPPTPAREDPVEPAGSLSSWSSSSSSSGFARAVTSWEAERSLDLCENPERDSVALLDARAPPEAAGGGTGSSCSREPAVERSTAAVQTDFEGGAPPELPTVSDAGTNTEPVPGSTSQASQADLVQEERLPPEGRAGRVPGVRKVFAWQSRSTLYDGAPATLFRETVVRVRDASTEPAEAAAAAVAACQTEGRPPEGVGEEEEVRGEDLGEGGWVEIEVVPALEAASDIGEGTPRGGGGADDDVENDAAAALQALGVTEPPSPVRPPRPRLWEPERDGYFDDDECPPRALPAEGELAADGAEAAPAPPGAGAQAAPAPPRGAPAASEGGGEGLPDDLKDPESLKLEVLWLLEALDRRRCHLRETLELAAGA